MVSASAVILMFLVTFSCFVSSMEARKLLEVQEMENKKMVPPSALDARLYLNALPKGKVPASTPSNKGHAGIISETLIARHLAAIDRILRSVPSPGVGH